MVPEGRVGEPMGLVDEEPPAVTRFASSLPSTSEAGRVPPNRAQLTASGPSASR